MTREHIETTIAGFVGDLVDDDSPVSASASFDDMGVDSMSTMDLLARVEKEFGVAVPDERVDGIVTISDLTDFVAAERGVPR